MLIDAEGYNYPRLAAYVPGMQDIVNAQMDRAADFIIRWGAENTTSGSWCIYFEDLEKHLDLTVREGNGMDSMLRTALKQRPEVSAVDMHDGCIEMEYHPEYCRQLNGVSKNEALGPRLKEILPVLAGGGLTLLTHEETDYVVLPEKLLKLNAAGQEDYAALLDARVAEIVPGPEGTEVVLTEVAPEELVRFNEAHEAERAMGPAMGGRYGPI